MLDGKQVTPWKTAEIAFVENGDFGLELAVRTSPDAEPILYHQSRPMRPYGIPKRLAA